MCSIDDYHKGLHKLKNLSVEGLFPGHGILMLRNGQESIDAAFKQLDSIFMPHSVSQNILQIL